MCNSYMADRRTLNGVDYYHILIRLSVLLNCFVVVVAVVLIENYRRCSQSFGVCVPAPLCYFSARSKRTKGWRERERLSFK